jgi:hypothetical protein
MSIARNLLTVGEIARRLGQPQWRIEYAIRSRSIEPTARAGNARVFAESDVVLIEILLRRFDSEKGGIHVNG